MEFMKIMVAKSNLDSHGTQPNKHLALAQDSKMPAMDSLTAADSGLKSKADVIFRTKKRANSFKKQTKNLFLSSSNLRETTS